LGKSRYGGPFPVPQRSAIEHRLGDAAGQVREASCREDMGEDQCHCAGIRRQGKTWQPVRVRNPDQGARRMQILLGLAHIGTLFHKL